jgi:hypothetical protein
MKTILLSALFLALAPCLFGQNLVVEDGALPESELHVAINPNDSNNIVLAVMKGTFDSDTFSRISIYYTNDYGESWQKSAFIGKSPGTFGAGDPVLAFDRNGRVYLVSLTLTDFDIRTLISWSDDGGATWQTKSLKDGTDKPWFAIDRSPSSPFVDRKYIPEATFFWFECLTLGPNDSLLSSVNPASGDYGFVQLGSVDVQADGDVFVGFYHEGFNGKGLSVARSSDGGATFSQEVLVATTTLEIFTSITGIVARLNLSPYIGIDRSNGLFKDRIYYTYTDNEPGENGIFDVYLSWSDDDSATWTTPKKVHENTPNETQQFYSSIYVTENGTLLLGWYDRRDDPSDKLTNFYLGISNDGGETFQELKVSSEPSDFSTIGSVNNGFGIGDYGQIIATANTALPFWADGRSNDGDMNVYFARVPLNGLPVSVPEIMTVTEHVTFGLPYPIPALDKINVAVNNVHPERFVCSILSADGKTLHQQDLGTFPAGKNLLTVPMEAWEGTLLLRIETKHGVLRTFKIR